MKVVVFGANGNVGRRVVELLLNRGHTVTAVVHGEHTLAKHSNLKCITGDIRDSRSVQECLKQQEAVISCLGSWGTKTKDILTVGMQNIIPKMEENQIYRIVSLTGADAHLITDKPNFLGVISRFALSIFAHKILRDGEIHLKLLYESSLNWTVVRSPVMNDKGSTKYKLSSTKPLPWSTIDRLAVATALVDELEGERWLRKSPYISRV